MDFIRATQPAQKRQRRETILDAAATLLAEGGLEAVGLNAIARQAGLSKSNLYRYFESREQILLELLLDDERLWVADLERGLAPLAQSADVDAVADVIATTLAAHSRLCQLSAVLSAVLETNLSPESVAAFKTAAKEMAVRISNAIFAALPQLGVEATYAVQHQVHALVAGLWPICHPSPVVGDVVERDGFELFRHDFETDLRQGVRWLLRGVAASGAPLSASS